MTDPHLDVAGYALDALTDHERAEFEAHLAGCPDCQQRLREFTESTADLSWMEETAPPDEVRAGVLAAIAQTPQDASSDASEHAGAVEPDSPARRAPDDTLDGGGSHHGLPPEMPDPRRRSRARRIGQIALAAAVAVVLAIGGWVVGRQQQVGQSVHQQQSAQSRLLRASDAQIHRQPMRGHGSVSYVVSQKQNAAMAIVSGNPKPGSGKTFQLWTMHGPKGDQPKPDRTFSGAGSHPVWLKTNVSSAAAVAVTVEPKGGSKQPTTKPFAAQKF